MQSSFSVTVRGVILVAAAGIGVSCGGTTTPTPIDPGAPTLSCPATPAPAQAADSSGAVVVFGSPSASGGSPPLAAPTCTAASGSRFPVGTTTVTCTVSDAKARSAAPCSFDVVVTPAAAVPKLSLTRFLAFGDSMTAGEVVSEGFGVAVCPDVSSTTSQGFRPFQIDPQASWPTQLQAMLTRRYLTQTPVIEDYGCNGEPTTAGLARLRRILPNSQAQIMLLLEGANDIVGGSSAIAAAVANLDSMVNYARSRGLKVVVATLPPENPAAPTTGGNCSARYQAWQSVAPFNVGLKSMAAQENIPVADVFQALNGNLSTYIDCDGLHPTPAGYEAMAKTFYDVVTKNFEIPTTTTAFPSFAPRVDRARRR